MAALIPETAKRVFKPETLMSAARQSDRCLTVPVRLRRAIKKYLREQDQPFLRRKVLRLSTSFSEIKDVNLQLAQSASRELVEDPLKSVECSRRWKITSSYGDIGLKYRDDETVAYVASRMPAVYSACFRVLKEIRKRLPDFSPARVLDFGAGTGSAFWALREVWPKSLEKVNLVEPSQPMQRAGRNLTQGMKNVPIIHSYDSIQSLSKNISKAERPHDLVIASYVLGEIPSLKDRVTTVRQLWDLTGDVLILVEPGTPHGSKIISQMRSLILWMEKRKLRKAKLGPDSKDLMALKSGVFIVAPCPHDGPCPLEKSEKYCHFVQRLERTSSQRAYKRSKGVPLRGFEDEKFCYVAFRRGQRPRESWPLDGTRFETLKEQHAKRNPEDLEIDLEDFIRMQEEREEERENARSKKLDMVSYDSDIIETDNGGDETDSEEDEDGEEDDEDTVRADLGGGWGRIIFTPVRRGRQVALDVCRSTERDGSKGAFEHVVVTKSKNPTMHHQARRSNWGDLWPY
ncbi:hypothetical protein MLD38_018675 [Melastoma candidum]|uniref:Uncharacterized protein n=1 Tax=Melastoma candidum TaxID=119954 RepID=A0ACB9R2T8_9MYRT|nr:hypothetical protein MLD38_018675 [Melastoma candidum]